MFTVTNRCERCNVLPPQVKTGNAGTVGDVLADRSGNGDEFLLRAIQNVSGVDINVAYHIDASANSYHTLLVDKGQLAIPTLGRVSVFCASAWTVLTMEVQKTQG